MKKKVYEKGDRVWLLPFEEEPLQAGTICGDPENEMYVVQLDEEYFSLEEGDDGLRELDASQMKPRR
jgi:hypothetical protein